MRQKVINILKDIRPEFDFNHDINFIKNCMLDSFDIVNLVCELDIEFGISIDGTEIIPENFATLDSIVNLLNKTKRNYEPDIS